MTSASIFSLNRSPRIHTLGKVWERFRSNLAGCVIKTNMMDIEKKKEDVLKELTAAFEAAETEVDKLQKSFDQMMEENQKAKGFLKDLDLINNLRPGSDINIRELVQIIDSLDKARIRMLESGEPVMVELGTLTLQFYELAKILTEGLSKLYSITHLQPDSMPSSGALSIDKKMAQALLQTFNDKDSLLVLLQQSLHDFNLTAKSSLEQASALDIAEARSNLDKAQANLEARRAELEAARAAIGK